MIDTQKGRLLAGIAALGIILATGILVFTSGNMINPNPGSQNPSEQGSTDTGSSQNSNPFNIPGLTGTGAVPLLEKNNPASPDNDPATDGVNNDASPDESGGEQSDGSAVERSLSAFPGYSNVPTDPDNDGIYEDLNGNGRKDFSDVVIYYENKDWISDNQPVSLFDLDGDSDITDSDVVLEYDEVPATS